MSGDDLEALIRDEVIRKGPMPFARFMDLALYHPSLGYYAGGGAGREPVGWTGDYYTSGDVHPLWGWCLAQQLHQMWELMGQPARFDVVEPGAGRGMLARSVWAYALECAPEWASALHYTLIEAAPRDNPLHLQRADHLEASLRALDVSALTRTRWADALAEAAPDGITGCIVANELVDALPVHLVEKRERTLCEVYVALDARTGRLVERLALPSRAEVATYLDAYHIPWRDYPDGWRAEVCLAARDWKREAAHALARGFLLTLDYGDSAHRLYTRDRRHGTLAVYSRHQLGERPLARPGAQDLTAHVNFTALVDAGRTAGLHVAGLSTQRAFLQRLGIRTEAETRAARLYPAADTDRASDRGQADHLHRGALRAAVSALLAPDGLGGFRVLALQRGVPGASRRLVGFTPAAREPSAPAPPPSQPE